MATDTAPNTIPFNKLSPGADINARTGGGKDGLEQLAASIRAKGVIQPLIVRPREGNRFEVIAGNRRLAAIGRLVKQGEKPKSWPVPVVVRDEGDAEALDTSLAENDCRLPMHPVDRYEAIERLTAQGLDETEIAARYAMSVRQVKQSRALAALSPKLREAWRKGKIDAGQAQSFTAHPDHAVQEAVYAECKRSPYLLTDSNIRHKLLEDRPKATTVSPALLERYTAEGGRVTEDLFAEATYIEDGALFKTVEAAFIAELVEQEKAALAGQGWAWIAGEAELPDDWRWQWDTIEVEWELSAGDQARIEAIEARIDAARSAKKKSGDPAAVAKLEREIDAIREAAELAAFTPEMRARSGVVIEVFGEGDIQSSFGVIRPSADGQTDIESAIDAVGDQDDEELPPVGAVIGRDDEEPAEAGPFAISQALAQTLSEIQTVAAAEALKSDADLALVLVTAALTCRFNAPAAIASQGHASVRTFGERNFAETFATLLAAEMSDLGPLFAAAVASTLDLTVGTWRTKSRDTGIDQLIGNLPPDAFLAAARKGFSPVDYFNRTSKAVALAALAEIREAGLADGLAPDGDLAGLKKAELSAAAVKFASASGWLPPELRAPAYALVAMEGV